MDCNKLTEGWTDIKGYEGLYQISTHGRVKGMKTNTILKYENNHNGYYQVKLFKNNKGLNYRVHRLVAINWIDLFDEYEKQNLLVDHKDGNPYNNHYTNLRWATNQQNLMNQKKHKNNKSGFKGVYYDKKAQCYRTQITFNNKRIHLGYFKTKEEAHEAYKKKAIELFGEFARFK